ncbi:hypothetical protein KC332_g7049 [Hortaea werneckii]|uniref:Uncharacterized protein n=1 Tax=Hortaea werneckii TaxID=91943 RepID=A0A3M7I8K5_HORWE|nr:hypothetical protein KC358_g14047 [Hortaea werneckii]KAI6815858.1 hypothetical protein KC342_g15748 [Hortaea werneckii]KAI6850782.1 hypothetical protein KC350_g1954 [Hortaea werneckii]KAI6942360.1 hypothetical protein KC341_g2294 [Hortaea werneckii]KAI6943208.1 hypothetical protein KC348_g4308 [Hortaea werneckii]
MGLTQHQPIPARRHFMMTSPRAQAGFHHQQFFFEQKDKLAHLLNTIGTDARNATSISISSPASSATSSDYHELLTVTTQLLSDAQSLSTWTFDMIESNGPQVEPFAEKVALVERVAGELRERVLLQQQQQMQTTNTITTPNTAESRSCAPSLSAASSKKRGRSGEDDMEEEGQQQQYQPQYQQSNTLSHKRSRVFAPVIAPRGHYYQHQQHQQQQQQQQQQQDIMSGIEQTTTSCGTHAESFLQTPWWTQRPICD